MLLSILLTYFVNKQHFSEPLYWCRNKRFKTSAALRESVLLICKPLKDTVVLAYGRPLSSYFYHNQHLFSQTYFFFLFFFFIIYLLSKRNSTRISSILLTKFVVCLFKCIFCKCEFIFFFVFYFYVLINFFYRT